MRPSRIPPVLRAQRHVTACRSLQSFLHRYAVFKVRHRPSSEGGGDNEIRTHDPLLARQVLSQLSYTPELSVRVLWTLKIEYRMSFFPRLILELERPRIVG
jgi:hypothetical protein